MTFHDRVNALCAERGISITKLASELGFSSSTPNNWRDMAGLPRAKTVKAVADYFGVSVDYLKGDDAAVNVETVQDNHGIIGPTHAPVTIVNGNERKLSEQEMELLSIFEQLSVMDRAKLLVFASELQNK
jgi:transcriptional regulator with XRE-family HTH domain